MWIWILILFAWLVVLGISVRNRRRPPPQPPSTETNTYYYSKEIPKIIYTFWDSYPENVPPIVEKSIDTWKKYCPGYDIRVLNYENTSHMGIRHKDSHARYADFVRLYVLEKTGGIWMDASVFLQKPLDDWLTYDYDYTGYYAEYNTDINEWPVVESWFMAAPKGSPFVRDWKNEFFRANEFETIGDYADDVLSKGVDTQRFGIVDNGHYLAIYLAEQYCVQKLERKYNLNLMSCDVDAFKYKVDTPMFWLWGLPSVNNLCDNIEEYKNVKMVKISNDHRKYIDETCISKL